MMPVAAAIEDYLDGVRKDITVAIMGCAVNGIGEAKDAQIAVAGGKDEALLYVDGRIVRKIPQADLVEALKKEIDRYGG
jgi:(E)-4-hydroxy-3-methylbut-2-enyl-diphosphate synthase